MKPFKKHLVTSLEHLFSNYFFQFILFVNIMRRNSINNLICQPDKKGFPPTLGF